MFRGEDPTAETEEKVVMLSWSALIKLNNLLILNFKVVLKPKMVKTESLKISSESPVQT